LTGYLSTNSIVSVGWITADTTCVSNAEASAALTSTASATTSEQIKQRVPFLKSRLFYVLLGCGGAAVLLLLVMLIYCSVNCCCKRKNTENRVQ